MHTLSWFKTRRPLRPSPCHARPDARVQCPALCVFVGSRAVRACGLLNMLQARLQVWECLFRVTVVDAVVRLAGVGAKALVLLAARAAPEERCRRRGQVLEGPPH